MCTTAMCSTQHSSLCSNRSLTQPELRLCLKSSILPWSSLLASFPHPSTSLSSCSGQGPCRQPPMVTGLFLVGVTHFKIFWFLVTQFKYYQGDPKLLHYNNKLPHMRTWQPRMPNRINLEKEQRPKEIAGLTNYKIGCDTGKGEN